MRVLSGIQPTGRFHWGNYFGAIRQYIALQRENDAFYFVANYHALTSVRDPETLRGYVFDVFVDLLALGLDPERDLQQQIVNLLRDPGFTAFYHGGNYLQDVTVTAPGSAASRPRKLALHLHPYGEGRRLLLSRDVTAVEQAEAMRRDFVANVSHEIRTPLTVLAGFVETLQTLELSREETVD